MNLFAVEELMFSIAYILNEMLLVIPLANRALKFTKYTKMHH